MTGLQVNKDKGQGHGQRVLVYECSHRSKVDHERMPVNA